MNPNLNLTGNNRYLLRLSGTEFLNNEFELQVTGFNLPGVTSGLIEPATPIRPLSLPGGTLSFDDLNVTFIVTETLSEWLFVYDWMRTINFGDRAVMREMVAIGELFITNNKFVPILSFNFQYMFPYMLGSIDYSSDVTSIDTLLSTVSFKFMDMNINTVF